MTTKPRYCLLMFQGTPTVNWCELERDEWAIIENQPQRYSIFVIEGSEITVLVATEDKTLKRANALKTASSFVFGQYLKIEIDLKNLVSKIEAGIDHTKIFHPPY